MQSSGRSSAKDIEKSMWALCGNLSSIIKFKELHLPGDTVNSKDKLDPNKFEQNFGPKKIWSKKLRAAKN